MTHSVTSSDVASKALAGRSFVLLLTVTLGGFAGYVLLLPVVPLWAVVGGAGEIAAGATNGILMLVTVLTQLGMPWLLRRVDHRLLLGLGTFLIGVPTPLFAVSTEMWVLLSVSGLRGVGFGLLTVSGSALIAELVPARHRGHAAGLYGLSVGVPHVFFLPAGMWLVQHVGFAPLFWIACVVPVAATPAIVGMAPVRPRHAESLSRRTFPASLISPWTIMVVVSLAAGGLLAFLPLAVPASVAPPSLFLFGAATLLGRWLAGVLGDRTGAKGVLLPAVCFAAFGMVACCVAAIGPGWPAMLGAIGIGGGFGAIQNVTLVMMFERTDSAAASTVWNIAYDGGNGLGAVSFGLLVTVANYPVTFLSAAVLVICCAPLGWSAARAARPRA